MTLRMALAACGVLLIVVIAAITFIRVRSASRDAYLPDLDGESRSSPFLNTVLSDDAYTHRDPDQVKLTVSSDVDKEAVLLRAGHEISGHTNELSSSSPPTAANEQLALNMALPDNANTVVPNKARVAGKGSAVQSQQRAPLSRETQQTDPDAVQSTWSEQEPFAVKEHALHSQNRLPAQSAMRATPPVPDDAQSTDVAGHKVALGAAASVSTAEQTGTTNSHNARYIGGRYDDRYNRALTDEVRYRHTAGSNPPSGDDEAKRVGSTPLGQPSDSPVDSSYPETPTQPVTAEPESRPVITPRDMADRKRFVSRSYRKNGKPVNPQASTQAPVKPARVPQRPEKTVKPPPPIHAKRRLEREVLEVEDAINRTLTPSFDVNHISDDPQIDYVAHLYGASQSVPRMKVLSIYRQREFDIDKPHRLFGLSDPTGTWVDLDKDAETGRYTEFVMTLQLADADGCVSESDLTRFSDMTLTIAEKIAAQFRFSHGLDDGLEQGRSLQSFCQRYDVLSVINILLPEGRTVTGTLVDSAARELGLTPGKMSIYHKVEGKGVMVKERFSLANMFNPGTFDQKTLDDIKTRGVSLFFNVPTTSRPEDALEDMIKAARDLCARFDGQLVDQGRKHLGDHGIELIRKKVAELAQGMESEGILPGGEKAIKLFN